VSEEGQNDVVQSQDPVQGAWVNAGSTVTLSVGVWDGTGGGDDGGDDGGDGDG
jgi:beta-lactam-binding protein with PASTA domain